MKVIADTGPIIGLASIERLDLLTVLAERVLIPPTVRRELLAKPGSGVEEIDEVLDELLQIREVPRLESTVADSVGRLDPGEAQAIGLASSFEEEVLLLIDDRAGRRVADELGLPKTGLVGLLLRAKEKGRINEVTTVVRELQANGYWLSEEIVEIAQRRAGEAEG